ncbi:MAG TPA: ATP-binding protein, partial [Planctomycetaceae bacterium]|nr:ATP-binding protein [Planctomycetaceae bacterium]
MRLRERDGIIQALRAGVVPKLGLQHIQVGRVREVEEMVKDVGRVIDGGATIRFIIGEYGAGKTFFLNLVRLVALEKGLVVFSADLGPDRRLHATGGQARSLFA